MTSAKIITTDELKIDPVPTMRLRLQPPPIASKDPSWLSKEYWIRMFQRAEAEAEFESHASPEATRRNKERLRKIEKDIQDKIHQQFQKVEKEMENLTEQQQVDVITFWSGVRTFLTDILDWLSRVFNDILEKIREGWRLVKETVKEIFKRAYDAMKSIF